MMAHTIRQTVTFRTSPETLFDTYLDSRRHAAVTGRRVKISRKAGHAFSAFNGIIRGRNLLIVPTRLIVQAWRAKSWKTSDLDSILILAFTRVRGGARLDLVHVNVPQHDLRGVREGWRTYYWKPWKASLKKTDRKK